mmetsp:Transcript_52459/g.79613  ORF Transcript_52459/g.79613 Transcript_52459/m.79613 type:complete len:117 (-) Transcript_52459:444-794(-)
MSRVPELSERLHTPCRRLQSDLAQWLGAGETCSEGGAAGGEEGLVGGDASAGGGDKDDVGGEGLAEVESTDGVTELVVEPGRDRWVELIQTVVDVVECDGELSHAPAMSERTSRMV